MTQVSSGRRRLSERIADDLQREILGAAMAPGQRLPTEAELAERFDVSRTVVREAAKLLVQRGLVSVAPGRGMAVREFDGGHIAEQFSLLMMASDGTFDQLLELRLALEVQVANLVARDPSPEILVRLEATIATGEDLLASPGEVDSEAFLDADMTFHELLAEASGNPFFELVSRPINTFLRSHYRHREHYPSDPRRTLEEHRELLEAIRRRDTFGAHRSAEVHLRRLLRKWGPGVPVTQEPSVRLLNTQNAHLADQMAVGSRSSQES